MSAAQLLKTKACIQTVRYLGVDVEEALTLAEGSEV